MTVVIYHKSIFALENHVTLQHIKVKYFQLPERQVKFLWREISIKITSLAKYFAGAERNDEVENES